MAKKKNKKRWLSGLHGWDKHGNVIETWWIGDPAIDFAKSDGDRYVEELEKEALVVLPDEEPELLRITLPAPGQIMEIREAFRGSLELGATTAFALCVRFPGLEKPDDPEEEPLQCEYRGGSVRLPAGFLRSLVNDPSGADMITTIGLWIWRKAALSDSEKKVSSPASTAKTSGKPAPEKPGSTTVEDVTTSEGESKDAQS